jgi:CubicO group peptidase (beta-lactamase class C family)
MASKYLYAFLLIHSMCFARELHQTNDIPKSTAEAQGVSSSAILDFIHAVESEMDALHSLVLMRHGKVVAEGWWAPYEAERPHMLYSLSKSFTATAIGMAVDEKQLSLDDKVVSFFPDRVPADASENLNAMRIRDLLCMGTGNHDDTLPAMKDGGETDWIKVFLSCPVEHQPGTHFRYNTGATYMLSAILQKVTGEKLLDYLTPRLFDPLGIKNPSWESSAQGIHTGGYGLKVKTQDIAKLGQLYLQKGMWNGKRLLSEAWVQQATSNQISTGNNPKSDWNQGYGFQFWRCRHNAYRGDGAFGQYCVVMPDQDAVLAITSGLGNMQQVLDLAWQHLLPGMNDQALPPNPDAAATLHGKLSTLQLKPVHGEPSSPKADDFIGKVYHFKENERGLQRLSLSPLSDGLHITLHNTHGEQRIPCGFGEWKTSTITLEKALVKPVGETNGLQPIAASGAWTTPERFVATVYFNETPFKLTQTLQFKDEQLFLNLEYNVRFSQKKWQLTGSLTPPNLKGESP